jgi:hypothetical protein
MSAQEGLKAIQKRAAAQRVSPKTQALEPKIQVPSLNPITSDGEVEDISVSLVNERPIGLQADMRLMQVPKSELEAIRRGIGMSDNARLAGSTTLLLNKMSETHGYPVEYYSLPEESHKAGEVNLEGGRLELTEWVESFPDAIINIRINRVPEEVISGDDKNPLIPAVYNPQSASIMRSGNSVARVTVDGFVTEKVKVLVESGATRVNPADNLLQFPVRGEDQEEVA